MESPRRPALGGNVERMKRDPLLNLSSVRRPPGRLREPGIRACDTVPGRMGQHEDECPFCQLIVTGDLHRLVCHDGDVAVLTDIAPINLGHLLVIPVAHASSLAALDPVTGGRMFAMAQRCAAALRASPFPCDGVNIIMNDGQVAGQTIEHVHLHVLPRSKGDAFQSALLERVEAGTEQLAGVATFVRAELGGR